MLSKPPCPPCAREVRARELHGGEGRAVPDERLEALKCRPLRADGGAPSTEGSDFLRQHDNCNAYLWPNGMEGNRIRNSGSDLSNRVFNPHSGVVGFDVLPALLCYTCALPGIFSVGRDKGSFRKSCATRIVDSGRTCSHLNSQHIMPVMESTTA